MTSRGLVCAQLGLLLVAAAASAETVTGAAAAELWARLKGDAAGPITYEWITGTAYGIPADAPSRPLFRIESVTVREVRREAPSSFLERSYACRLYRDAATGAFIDRFVNPFTGKSVALVPRCSDAPALRYGPDRVELLGSLKFESSVLGRPMELERIDLGEEVVIRREAHSQFVSPSSGELRRETSLDVFTVDARALADPSISRLSPVYQWTSSTQWMADLGMGDRPGRMLWVVHGRNFGSIDELPADFRAALRRALPDAFDRKLPPAPEPPVTISPAVRSPAVPPTR